MKKAIVSGLGFVSFLVCCKKEKVRIPAASEKIINEEPVSHECYCGIINKDTFLMNLTIKENQMTKGKLSYKFAEKDKNEGTLGGELRGDTIIAYYTFMSKDVSSVRQVTFLKNGNNYV